MSNAYYCQDCSDYFKQKYLNNPEKLNLNQNFNDADETKRSSQKLKGLSWEKRQL